MLNLSEYRNTIYMNESMINKTRDFALSRFSSRTFFLLVLMLLIGLGLPCAAQDWIRTGTGLGVDKVRIAVPDFKPSTSDSKNADLQKVFDATLFSDLDNAGIFDLVSKSFYPLDVPGSPTEVHFDAWSNPPVHRVHAGLRRSRALRAPTSPYTGGSTTSKTPRPRRYWASNTPISATTDAARTIAHRFANEIIFRLGGGIAGIAESKIYFVSERSGHKEIWVMDYDGANQHAVTHLGIDFALAAHFSRRLAAGVQFAHQDELGNQDVFHRPQPAGLFPVIWRNESLALVGVQTEQSLPSLRLAEATQISTPWTQPGGNLHRLTSGKGPDVAPTWNRKTGAQLAFVSGRTGLPQVYTMEADGTNIQRVTDQGYAVSPSWSPNGQFLALAWFRKYGPGAPGANDIYLMDIASKQWVQLTHDGGRNDFP